MALSPKPDNRQSGITFPRPPVRLWGTKSPALPLPPWRFLELPDEDSDVLGLLNDIETRLAHASRRLDRRRY
ncbi:hypothetical protein [Stomatohabitans albus]|uniref:hypothetical protein n=1 Tax=Stomatohabitans albus TaxID=3110766 RepID=UPI00300D3EC3